MPFGLTSDTIDQICSVFARHPEVRQAILYGSRAMGTQRDGSDIDLTLTGKALNLKVVTRIETELDDLLLPHEFDLSIRRQIDNGSLLNHIERVGILFYERERGSAGQHQAVLEQSRMGAAVKKGWPTKTLGEVLEKTETVNPLQSPNLEFDYIDVSSVSNTTFEIEATQRLKGKDAPSRARKLVRTNDVIFATIRPTLQRIAVVPEHLDNQVCSTGYLVLRPKPGIDHRFVFYSLFTEDFIQQMQGLQKGASYPAVTDSDVRAQQIPVPPLPEQQRIVGLLDESFEGLSTSKANAEKNLQNARALFESHLQSVFTQRGPGWVEKRLDELCTFSSGGTPSKGNSSYWQGEIPWVSGRDMKSTRLSDSALHISQAAVDESATRMASAGTLLILVRGMGLAHGAQIAELLVPCAFNQDIRGIHAKPSMLPRYLLFALRDGINSSDTVLSNAAHGTLKIDSNELQKVMIPFPPLEQQRKIIAVIDALTEETQRLARLYERKLAALEALKKSLLHQAFTGEL